ncbi:dehydrogenase-like protein [Salmonella enterica subsp. enterica]|uniref:Dehydrogenase-like protein n=1 Tax=Salmonella enterica I TaxID=59201 RepID=A0A447U567_SALET|nr:dehydrogenase-like protein [Salmonella enterica subsp. enterica]
MIVATVTYPARWMAQSLMVNPVNVRRCGLSSIMKLEMQYLHDVINGLEPGEEFAKLLTGEAATKCHCYR